jgi:hypothetical protein
VHLDAVTVDTTGQVIVAGRFSTVPTAFNKSGVRSFMDGYAFVAAICP